MDNSSRSPTLPPLVSVILPTHNRSEMLKRAINSILSQTWKDFELIIISDGSTDNTEDVVLSFQDSRIHLLQHEIARGASAARNAGLRVANGKFIAFLDDDDEWTQDKLEVQVPILEKTSNKVGLVYAWMEYIKNDIVVNERKPTITGNIFPEMLDKQAITNSSTLLIRREVLATVTGFDETLPRGNDGDFIRRISKYYEVDYVPKVLCKVHVGHEDRISVNSKNNLKNALLALEKRLELFHDDFTTHPNQKSNVHSFISVTSFQVGEYKKSLAYLTQIITSDISTKQKINLFWRIFKSITRSMV